MEGDKTEFVDKTILNTPQPTACSTVNKKSLQRNKLSVDFNFENTLGLINENEIRDISKDHIHSKSLADVSYELEQQRLLANSSLQRANKVAGLPSKYLKPNLCDSAMSNLTDSSMFSERDLLQSPRKTFKNTSTPRTSAVSNSSEENNISRLSLGQSIAQLSYQIGNTDISIDNFVAEFQKAMNNDKGISHVDSKLFSPAEEAASMLLADEISWRRQNEVPLVDNFSKMSVEDPFTGKISMGEFFQQKSDTLSDLGVARSPEKSKNPIPLIDSSISFEEESNGKKKDKNSLSISAIQKLLAETKDTPRKVTSYLLKQGQKLVENSIDQLSLPVSKDSSYTSNYSDNEAIRQIVANKENIDSYNIPQREHDSIKAAVYTSDSNTRTLSTGSSRSLSSGLTSLPNGKLPIESTKTELIWGCVKVDKCVTQDFLLRNKTSKRLRLQMSISGYEFKIMKDNRQESSAKISLNPHESRTIIVSYIPSKIGAAADELCFKSLDSNLQQTKKQSVRLFGYGGFGKIDIINLTKDIAGRFWLSLGKLDNNSNISYSFVVKNSGNLPCFACITFNPKELFVFANISVTPSSLVLIPDEQKEITVTFILSMEDHQVLQKSVFSRNMIAEIGNLVITSGTEANRGRLRRQCRKYAENGLKIDPVSNVLKEKIKGEIIPSDTNLLKESPGNLKEILKFFIRNEVVVTIEQDPEVTIMPQYPDESGMFQSLCQDTTAICLETTALQTCKVEPTIIILTPPAKIKDSLFLISECSKKLNFAVVCNSEGLDLFPKEGVLAPGQEIVINVACPKLYAKDKKIFKVQVYVENEVLEATVKISFINN